jgi:hypothetical protein
VQAAVVYHIQGVLEQLYQVEMVVRQLSTPMDLVQLFLLQVDQEVLVAGKDW